MRTPTPQDADGGSAVTSVPYFWSDWYGHRIQFVGVPHDAEVVVLADEPYLALYRRNGSLVGALTIDRPTHITKLRRLIAQGASSDEGRPGDASRPRSS